MKTSIFCACLLTMLIISVATFGEISSSGPGSSSSASADASKGDPNDYWYEENWHREETDTAGYFEWSIEADASAYAEAIQGDGWVEAEADASGAAAGPNGTVSRDAYAYVSDSGNDFDFPPSDTDGGTDWFSDGGGVSGQCDAWAYAAIEEGSTSSCYSYASSHGIASLSEH